jgi:hypothetical protein
MKACADLQEMKVNKLLDSLIPVEDAEKVWARIVQCCEERFLIAFKRVVSRFPEVRYRKDLKRHLDRELKEILQDLRSVKLR